MDAGVVHPQPPHELERAVAQTYLRQITLSLRVAPQRVTIAVLDGEPARTILTHAACEGSALIAMTTYGWSGPMTWPLGSVTERVLHASTVSLLLVPPGRFPGGGHRTNAVASALDAWLKRADVHTRPDEDWLV